MTALPPAAVVVGVLPMRTCQRASTWNCSSWCCATSTVSLGATARVAICWLAAAAFVLHLLACSCLAVVSGLFCSLHNCAGTAMHQVYVFPAHSDVAVSASAASCLQALRSWMSCQWTASSASRRPTRRSRQWQAAGQRQLHMAQYKEEQHLQQQARWVLTAMTSQIPCVCNSRQRTYSFCSL
jgi:hypothetical protein